MTIYKKNVSLGGSWAKASELLTVKTATIVSETNPMPSSFTNKDGSPKNQDVCKVMFDGFKEPLNVSLNRATINGLVDAFGEDSKDWQNRKLAVETEKVRVAGKAVTALYLIPAGYKRIDDENGYPVILKSGKEVESVPLSEEDVVNAEMSEINTENIPF